MSNNPNIIDDGEDLSLDRVIEYLSGNEPSDPESLYAKALKSMNAEDEEQAKEETDATTN